jgi:hypothetical protein
MIPKEAYPYQTPVLVQYDSGDPVGCLDAALVAGDVKNFAARKASSQRTGKFRGLGFSTYVEACGLAPSRFAGRLGARGGLYESATVRVHPLCRGLRPCPIAFCRSAGRARRALRKRDRARASGGAGDCADRDA